MNTEKEKPLLIVLAGPTAVGKTKLSIELAKNKNSSIFSSDSRQFYREMSIGTAKPSLDELNEVPHYFINNKSIEEAYSAGDYEKEIINQLEDYFKNKKIAFLVGGSGMYIDAVCKGLDNLPKDLAVRNRLNLELKENGIEYLQENLKILDPKQYGIMDLSNSQRLIRALEVCRITSKPYSSLLTATKKIRSFKMVKFLLYIDKNQLELNIEKRVDQMVENGLFQEVENLRDKKNLNALNTVGYKEIFNFFNGNYTKEEAINLIKRNTKKYAKRQMTWFKKDISYQWIENLDTLKSFNEINSIITKLKPN
ncbi:MAG: tRNA (adenosine(37)-N6)-dimethylallyltransferase MiaA [Flavobacteriales bacterium]